MDDPSLPVPNSLIDPATCAPTSTTSSGSNVPVALTTATNSPRVTFSVRYVTAGARDPTRYHAPSPPTRTTTSSTGMTNFFMPASELQRPDTDLSHRKRGAAEPPTHSFLMNTSPAGDETGVGTPHSYEGTRRAV